MESSGHNRNSMGVASPDNTFAGLELDEDMIDESYRASSADNVLYFHHQYDQSSK